VNANTFQPVFVKFSKGSYIFVEGKQSAGRFYIIKEGKVQISRETDWETSKRNVVGPGGMFGIVSAMASFSYIESAMAVTDVVLMVVERKNYRDLICKSISVAVTTIQMFSRRLRKLNEALSQNALHNTAEDDPSQLYQVGLFFEGVGKSNQALYAYLRYLAYCPDANNADDVRKKIARLRSRVSFKQPKYSANTMVQLFPKDSLVFAEGEIGNCLYIIQKGSVKITKIIDNQEVVLEVLGKNDIFGEMALLEDMPRSATAEVCDDCALLAVNQANFTKLINVQSDLVVRMTTFLSERIWLRYKQLANTMIKNQVVRIYDALLTQLERNRVDLTMSGPYTCNFGFKELAGMAGISERDSKDLYERISTTKKIAQVDDKLYIADVRNLYKRPISQGERERE